MVLKVLACVLSIIWFIDQAYAAPIDLACHWQSPPSVGKDPGAREAAKFFSKPSEPAYFRIDLDTGKVENSDPQKTQAIVFPFLQLDVEPQRIKIVVPDPNMAGIKGRRAYIHIDIDRFTLQSFMALEIADKPGSRSVVFWLRDGLCVKKSF